MNLRGITTTMSVKRIIVMAGTVMVCVGSPSLAQWRAIETIEVPPSIEQGLEMIVVDAEAMPIEPELAEGAEVQGKSWTAGPVDLLKPINHLYTGLRRHLTRYQISWSALPQVRVPATGTAMAMGSIDPRVPILRHRLGLPIDGGFDEVFAAKVTEYQQTHGLPADGKVGADTLRSLNRGAAHYERLILLNMERVRRLPADGAPGKYILVDAGAARLWMYEDGKPKDSMRVIVGTSETQTPMMAALLRYVSLNPYWNVPPELARSLVAKNVLAEGLSYLRERDYEVLSDWSEDATQLDPATVDWRAVADGKLNPRIRRGPGPWNSMGQMKFMLPNDFGIYLHDVPDKAHFAHEARWLSNGCVRLEDAERLATWIFGRVPKPTTSQPDERVNLAKPIPVYFTYLTAEPAANKSVFRSDPYDRDAALLARFDGDGDGMSDADEVAFASVAAKAKKTAVPVRNVVAAQAKKPTAAKAALKNANDRKATGSSKTKASASSTATGEKRANKKTLQAVKATGAATAAAKRETIITAGKTTSSPAKAAKSINKAAQPKPVAKLATVETAAVPSKSKRSSLKGSPASTTAKAPPKAATFKPQAKRTVATTAANLAAPTKKTSTR